MFSSTLTLLLSNPLLLIFSYLCCRGQSSVFLMIRPFACLKNAGLAKFVSTLIYLSKGAEGQSQESEGQSEKSNG